MNIPLLGSKPALENELARLIPFENSRFSELAYIAFDHDIWAYMGMSIRTRVDLDAYRAQTLAAMRQGDCVPFLIVDNRSGRIAGSTRFGNLNIASEKCEIGWTWLGTEFQGIGLNKACKYELLRFGFEEVGFRRIQFSVDAHNYRSQRAVEGLGAHKEGVFRNNYIDADGQSRDDIYYSIIQEDWAQIKQAHFRDLGFSRR